MKNRILTVATISAIAIVGFGVAPSSQAATLRLEVPKPLMDIWKKLKTENTQAQEAQNIVPQTPSQPFIPPTPPPQINQQPINPDSQMPKPPMGEFVAPPNGQPDFNQNKNIDNKDINQLKQGAGQMDKMMDKFNNQMKNTERNGGQFSPEMKQKTSQTRQLLQKIKGADNVNDMGENTMEQVQSNMSELQQDEQNSREQTQRLKGMQQGVKNMERGLSMFEKQVAKLTKQGISAPSDVSENLAQAKKLIEAVKTAKTIDEIQSSGADDIGDIMQQLNDSRGQLEMLSRWPQTQKQIDKEIKNLDRALSRDKSIVAKLNSQGVDLNDNLQKISDAVNQLKTTREQAITSIKAGSPEDAFDTLENDFFGKMDDIREMQNVFETLGNLKNFNTSFKREMTNAKRQITSLEKQGQDITELKNLLEQANQKGNELLNLLKNRPIDNEMVASTLDELSSLRQDFQNSLQDLGGVNDLPWKQGKNQFQDLKVSPEFNKSVNFSETTQQ